MVVGAGAKPFIAYTILSVTDHGAGDEVIYPNPGFPIYESQIRAMGAVPVPIYLRESRSFNFDPAELEAKITPKTKLLILNSPQNPTGGIVSAKDMQAIAAILAKHPDIWVYADEIYSRLVYDGAFASLAAIPGMQERTIICDGASKTWAMTGWRIGYAVNKALAPVFTRWVTNTESCASHISQWAAVEALNGPQDDAEKMRASFLARRDLIVGLLNAGARRHLPEPRRRLLRVAQRDRGLPHDRRQGLGGVSRAPAERGRGRGARRHPLRPARARTRASTSASVTPPPTRPSRTAWRAWRSSCAGTRGRAERMPAWTWLAARRIAIALLGAAIALGVGMLLAIACAAATDRRGDRGRAPRGGGGAPGRASPSAPWSSRWRSPSSRPR